MPTIEELADLIYDYGQELLTYDPEDLMEPGEEEPYGECRLQVWDDGSWEFHTGSHQYDGDSTGMWAEAIIVPGETYAMCKTFAEEMLDEIEEWS